jgi:hypothetical protein
MFRCAVLIGGVCLNKSQRGPNTIQSTIDGIGILELWDVGCYACWPFL